MTTRYILLGGQLVQPYANTEIDPYANNYVSILAVDPDFAINSTLTLGIPQIIKGIAEPTFTNISVVPHPTVNPAITVTITNVPTFGLASFETELLDPFPGISSTVNVPTDSIVNYMRFINLSLEDINDVRDYPILPLSEAEVGDTSYYSIKSSLRYGDFTYVPGLSFTIPNSTILSANADLARGFAPDTVPSSLLFGNLTIDMEIDDPDEGTQLLPIESTLTLGSFAVGKAVTALSINGTSTFGLPAFGNFIHRPLIFKNDNIGKIGPNDSVEITDGMIFNPSSYNSNTATAGTADLPSSPVGFMMVTINGINFKPASEAE